MTEDVKQRKCIKCREDKPLSEFAVTSSSFFPGKRSLICVDCLAAMTSPKDLQKVDKLFQYLDLPFNPNRWTQLYQNYGIDTLRAYLNELSTDASYAGIDWSETNAAWQAILDQDKGNALDVVREERQRQLVREWSSDYPLEDLLWLDKFYHLLEESQNVTTPLLQEYAHDLCEIELRIKKGLRAGLDIKKDMDARDNMVKMGKFDATNAKNNAMISSIGELGLYCEKKGWHMDWHQEPKDSVDFTMQNIQQYLQRLIHGEPTISDQVENAREKYNTKERVEALGEEVLIDNIGEPDEYEGEDELSMELHINE